MYSEEYVMERFMESQTWIVVFDKCHGRDWWTRFLHPKFQHVHMLRDNRDYCLMVNCFSHVLAVREYPNTLEDIVKQETLQNPTAILQYTVHYSSHYKKGYIEPLTCVSLAKRLLGIRSRLITPKALYHELIKAGAIVIKPYYVV